MRWNAASKRTEELEEKREALIEEYDATAELITEALEEHDIEAFKKYVADIEPILKDLNAIKDELNLIGDMIDDAIEDERGDW